MTFDILLLIGVIAAFAVQARRIGRLERTIETLRALLDARAPMPAPAERPSEAPAGAPARVRASERAPATLAAEVASPRIAPVVEPPATGPEAPPVERGSMFETMVGGRLPIWVGGAALVIAGFFLVRYSIDSGLLGPAARVTLATLFAAVLLAGSEGARRLPATRDDARVGQVLAGAGIASGYGTLYVAAAQYHLVGAATGFALMIAITALALFLALRHGPPTAVMALIGGFSAPLVAGFDAAGIGPLLVYLAMFIAALFGLAARRGWTWLALAAVVAGYGWANLVVVLLEGRSASGVAAFVVVLAIAATLALPRTGVANRWLRLAPIVAGLMQMIVFASILDFSVVAWAFYLTLAGAAVVLATRDAALLPAAPAAAALLALLAMAAGIAGADRTVTLIAATIAVVLTGGAGMSRSRGDALWAATAIVGIAGPVLLLHASTAAWLPAAGWRIAESAGAGVLAMLAWRHRDRVGVRDMGLLGGSAGSALLAGAALAVPAGVAWAGAALAPVLVVLAWWSTRIDDRDLARLPLAVVLAQVVLAMPALATMAGMVAGSIAGGRLTWPMLPPLADVARAILIPAGAAAAVLAWPRGYGGARRQVATLALGAAVLCGYVLAKQPLAIAEPVRFVAFGFVERAAITLAFLAIGWWLAARTRFVRAGLGLVALALARFVWFDLLLLSPVIVAQSVGGVPALNLAVLLPATIAAACLTLPYHRGWRLAGLLAIVVAVLAGVRQVAHGTILTGGMEGGETWGYSAALLLLAVAWLGLGLRRRARALRVAGLLLLTVVTVKVFLIDVAALGGLLRILSLMGLGVALIGIGWAYNRIIVRPPDPQSSR